MTDSLGFIATGSSTKKAGYHSADLISSVTRAKPKAPINGMSQLLAQPHSGRQFSQKAERGVQVWPAEALSESAPWLDREASKLAAGQARRRAPFQPPPNPGHREPPECV
jgi:hypothetical protein